MLDILIDFIKAVLFVLLIIVSVAVFLLALPKMVEQATTDTQIQPYSGACPDYPIHFDDEEPWVTPTSREDVE